MIHRTHRIAPHRSPLRRVVAAGLAGVVLTVFLISCDSTTVSVLERDDLFRLEIGRLEDQVDLITRDGVLPHLRTSVAMQDGFIYIGNGPANKVMEFTSFGDLIRLIYDPLQNPEPISLGVRSNAGTAGPGDTGNGDDTGATGGSEAVRTRYATEYSFGQVGVVAVDSRRHLYVEDRVPPERSVVDDSSGVQLNRIVVRFDDEGEPRDYIGQEGIGGTPFSHIESLSLTRRDELIVIARTMDARYFFMYTPSGDLMYTLRVGLDRLPIPSPDSDMIPVLEEMVGGVDRYRAYLKVSYYRTSIDEETGKEYGITLDHSRVYWLDLDTGRYEGYVELPRETEGDGERHYELIGTTIGEYLLLLSRVDPGQTRLLIMNDEGRVVRRRNLYTPETDLVFREFAVTPRGVLTGLLGYEDYVDLVWWRADQLLPGIAESDQRTGTDDGAEE
ncbi:MAG: LIC_12708 family protein [Alkalispirochaeta sp.]